MDGGLIVPSLVKSADRVGPYPLSQISNMGLLVGEEGGLATSGSVDVKSIIALVAQAISWR